MTNPLTIYLLLDISASMAGAPLEALKQGVHLLRTTLSANRTRPMRISLITFESRATEILPPTDLERYENGIESFSLPEFNAGGSSGLGGGLRLLLGQIPEHSPALLYILTDGDPTDDWDAVIGSVRARVQRIYGLACGLTADKSHLMPFADEIYSIHELTPDMLAATFRTFT